MFRNGISDIYMILARVDTEEQLYFNKNFTKVNLMIKILQR